MTGIINSGGIITGSSGGLNAEQLALLNNAIQNTEKGAINGVAPLDVNAKVPLINLPNNLKEIKIVADITARDSIIVSDRFEGLYVLVEDATGDLTVITGWAIYILKAGLTNADWLKTSEGESINLILSAINTSYDNTVSKLNADNVQDAIDELSIKKQNKIFTYTVSDLTELNTITEMVAGNTAITLDTLKKYIYTTQWEEIFYYNYIVNNYSDLLNIANPNDGDSAFVKASGKVYIYKLSSQYWFNELDGLRAYINSILAFSPVNQEPIEINSVIDDYGIKPSDIIKVYADQNVFLDPPVYEVDM